MKATVSFVSSKVIISHKDKVPLEFSISMFGKDSFISDGIELFYYITEYWQSLSEEAQDKIYDLYLQFQEVMDVVRDKDEQIQLIESITTELMKFHKLDHLKSWVISNPQLCIPKVIPDVCVEDIDKNITRDRTIIKVDYLEILVLSLAMRAMVPIWGEYSPTIRKDAGNSHKEIYAYDLLKNTEYYFCKATDIIERYINAIVKEDKHNPNILNQGISSEDYARINMCTIAVRKLSVYDISGRAHIPDLIKLIYKSVVSKLQNIDRDYESSIRDKNEENKKEIKGLSEEKKLSVWERVRIVFDQDIGTTVELNHAARSYEVIITKLGLLGDIPLVEKCVTSALSLKGKPLEEPQYTILKWVMRDALIPRGIMYIETEDTVLTLLGIAQAKLWMEGHKYLSILSTCYMHTNSEGMLIAPPTPRDHVPKDIKDKISQVYPCRERTVDKKDSGKETNLTLQSIDNLTNILSRYIWKPTASQDMLDEIFNGRVTRVPIRSSIKIDLANLVLDIGHRWSFIKTSNQ